MRGQGRQRERTREWNGGSVRDEIYVLFEMCVACYFFKFASQTLLELLIVFLLLLLEGYTIPSAPCRKYVLPFLARVCVRHHKDGEF